MKASTHYDEHGQEWVVRMHTGDGSYCGLCGAVGQEEADIIVAAINGILGWQSGRSRLGLNDAALALRQYGESVFGAKAGMQPLPDGRGSLKANT